jgi:hypothetical protein
MTLIQLFHRHVVTAYDKQMRLADFLQESVGHAGWSFDKTTATLTFGKDVHFQAEILGSVDLVASTWLWAWANQASNIPDSQLKAARAMKEYGDKEQIAELATDLLVCDSILGKENEAAAGHVLGVIAVGLLGFDAYYSAPYTGGVAILLIRDARLQAPVEQPLPRILTIFPQALQGYPISDHKTALAGYLEYYGFRPTVRDKKIRVNHGGQTVLTARFDDLGRLVSLEGTAKAVKQA